MKHMEFQASYHQERLWFIDRFETGNVYPHPPEYHNIPLLMEIVGDVDQGLLQRSLQSLVERHEALRTIVKTKEERPVQVVCEHAPVNIKVVEFGHDDVQYKETEFLELARETVVKHFVMGEDQLLDVALLRLESRRHLLVVWIHHIIVDRVSLDIMAMELVAIYRALAAGQQPDLADLALHFADFSNWQRHLPAQAVEANLLYWKRKLKGKLQALELPVDFPRAAIHVYEEATHQFNVPANLLENARKLWPRKEDFVILLAVFKLLLWRYSGNEEVVVGTTSPYRQQPGTETVVGPLANLLVLRSYTDGELRFHDFLDQLEKTVLEARKHRDIPFDKLVADLKPDIDMSRTALFDVLFNLEEAGPTFQEVNGIRFKVVETNSGFGKYDVNLLLKKCDHGYTGYLNFNKLLFSEALIRQLVDHYLTLLERIVAQPNLACASFPLVTEGERERMLNEWNDTASSYPHERTIVHLFEDIATQNADRTALVYNGGMLSYRELDRLAGRCAGLLRERCDVRGGDLVALSMEPSLHLLVALLGVLKAGAVYVPIEPSQPVKRTRYVLKDSRCKVAIGDGLNQDAVQGLPVRVVEPADWIDWEAGDSGSPVPGTITSADPAYVIYTSGTTGQPKGCVVSHRNVARLFACEAFPFEFGVDDRWILAHAVNFDFSVWEIFGALLFGGRLAIVARRDVRNGDVFLRHISRYGITVLNQTPRAFYGLSEAVSSTPYIDLSSHLRYVIFGGDRLEPQQLKGWVERNPLESVRLVNMFGITETTVHVTFYPLTGEDIFDGNGASPVGVPLPETETYILGEGLSLQPVAVCGEIYVGGSGVASGYLNRPELSAERFLDNPFKPGQILYRSGDLGRWLRDGSIEYIGRSDGQVKVRGYRIEVGEIEHQMRSFEGVTGAVVIARRDGGELYLAGYYTAEGIFDFGDLRSFLLKNLPEYMVPAHFVQLETFPLTENGKLDTSSLPEPDLAAEVSVIPPNTETEAKLIEIWADVLNVDPEIIGIETNFFSLGGHSLNATLLVSRMHREFNVKLPIADIFTTPFIKDLGRNIDSAIMLAAIDLEAALEEDSDEEREEILI
jgi:syringomycin synthetase protein SyrE